MSGLTGNASDKQVLKNVPIITGLVTAKILAINPTKEQLEKYLDTVIEKEPEYTNIELKQPDGSTKISNKVTILYKASPVVTLHKDGVAVKERIEIVRTFDIFTQPTMEVASTGASKTINSKGVTTWSSIDKIRANEKMKWFIHEPLQECLVGQEIITNLMREYLNIDPKDNVLFADITKICSGDVTELRKYVAAFPNNEFIMYLDVKEGDKPYQIVYTKCFSRPTAATPQNKFAKAFAEQYGKPKVFKGIYDPMVYLSSGGDAPDTEAGNTASAKRNDFV
jgi:hypothetical protein